MTVIIDIRYPFGLVHATPWGTHVNQGVVEWPPSPWRLLRALVSSWRTRLPELADEVVMPLLDSLAEPPSVRMATRSESSLRTYIPSETDRSGARNTDLMIDTFAVLAPDTGVEYRWSVDLDATARSALTAIVEALPYLGRAESVCVGSVRFAADASADETGWSPPATDDSGVGVRSLIPTRPLVLDELCVSIRTMRAGKRLHPRGAQWMRYEVAEPVGPTAVRRTPASSRPTAVRLALTGPTLLSIRHAIVVGEAMRSAAMSQYGRLFDTAVSRTFAGKDASGSPLQGNTHAHWLALDLDADKLIDTVLVWAPGGVSDAEMSALGAIRELRLHGGDRVGGARSVPVALEGAGAARDLDLGRYVEPSTVWRSASAFLPQRHPKRGDVDAHLDDCIRRELTARGIPDPELVLRNRSTSWGEFRRWRRAERMADARSGFGAEIRFPQAVHGPIAIGTFSRYGLGLFVSEPSQHPSYRRQPPNPRE